MITSKEMQNFQSRFELAVVLLCAGIVCYFFGYHVVYPESQYSGAPFSWLWRCWNGERLDYGHGKLIPFAIGIILWKRRKDLGVRREDGRWWGITLVILGILMYLVSVRTQQPRIAVAGFPVIIVGCAAWLQGPRLFGLLLFPAFLFYFGIPVPGITQATNGLQVFATQGAHWIISIVGVESVISGNYINSPTDSWGFDIAEGCSGIRSLIALMLVSVMYGYFAHKETWKRFVLFLASMPIAIIANTMRVASIVFLAEFVSPEFAGGVYHDYSGFVFFPFGLCGMLIVSGLMKISQSYVVKRTLVGGIDAKV